MALKITIENLRRIKNLEFHVPCRHGVYLLVGPNGSGKTTILSCLDRIGNPQAFARSFVSSNFNIDLDQYKNAVIKYEQDNPSCFVSFRKGKERWSATPRHKSKCFSQFGFSSTVFIQADSRRISVPSEDIRPGKLVSASTYVIEKMNQLFETKRFDNLKRLRNTYGKGKTSRYFYVLQEGRNFYSEKRFSTGEIALLRLVEQLIGAPNKSLILLDEAELALHPRIQKNLIDFLNTVAEEKDLTVIVSTHSVTMIMATNEKQILLLDEKYNGYYEVVSPCYHARAIGSVDFIVNSSYDAIFFVEDEMAMLLLRKMLAKCIVSEEAKSFSYIVVPVGGYKQTSDLALRTKNNLFCNAKVFAVWDDDVFSESIPNNIKLDKYYEQNREFIYNLGYTPELWLIEKIETANDVLKKAFCDAFHIDIITILKSEKYLKCNSKKPRKLAKDKMSVILELLVNHTADCEEVVLNNLLSLVFELCINESEVKKRIMPMLGRI